MRPLLFALLAGRGWAQLEEEFLASLETSDTDPRAVFARLCAAAGGGNAAPLHRRVLLDLFARTYLNATLEDARQAQIAQHTLSPGASIAPATQSTAGLMDALEQFFAYLPDMYVPAQTAQRLVDRGSFPKFIQHQMQGRLAQNRQYLEREVLRDLSDAFKQQSFDPEL